MGIVYVLTNEKMPGLVKIGWTERTVEERLRELFGPRTSGVPVPFVCEAAWEFDDARSIETTLHRAYADRRVHDSREFFEVPFEQPIAILEEFGARGIAKDVTPLDDIVGADDPAEDQASLDRARKRRERFRFDMIGIKQGVILTSVWNDQVTCKVISENQVSFRDEPMSLSKAAKLVTRDIGKNRKSVSGPDSWKYNGKTLAAMRQELELQSL